MYTVWRGGGGGGDQKAYLSLTSGIGITYALSNDIYKYTRNESKHTLHRWELHAICTYSEVHSCLMYTLN